MLRALSVIGLTVALVGLVAADEVGDLVKEVNLKTADVSKRIKAMEKLAKMGPKAVDAGEALAEAMMDKSSIIRKNAAEALEAVDPEIHRHVVTIFIGQAKIDAVKAIGEMGQQGKAAVPVLVKLLTSPVPAQPDLHLAAMDALREIAPDDKRAARAIVTLVAQGPTTASRNPKGLWSQEQHAATEIRLAAIKRLDEMNIGAKDKVAPLIRALSDRQCVLPAIKILDGIGRDASEALPALKRLKSSPVDAVREAATEAVRSIENRQPNQ
jgi:HEAT repeat protein